jgi:hypothetical protein
MNFNLYILNSIVVFEETCISYMSGVLRHITLIQVKSLSAQGRNINLPCTFLSYSANVGETR